MTPRRAFAPYARLAGVLVVAGLTATTSLASAPPDFDDFSELDLESLLDQTIVTASKHPQKLVDAPVAATVITAEEIAASGARTIPELLRTVPGLDVLQSTSTTYDVSARGLNKPGTNSMLVLVDGRSVYVDFYGVVVWDQLSVSLEDIKAIEVIKGPGSAMHGANAFAGVINIITFTPDERPGNTVRTLVSGLGEGYGSLRHANRRGRLSWKLATAWDRASDWESDQIEAENARIDGQLRLDLPDDALLVVGGGHNNGWTQLIPLATPLLADGTNSYLRADYTRGDLLVRWYTNHWSVRIDPRVPRLEGLGARFESRLHDVELKHTLPLARSHLLLWGASYRHQDTRYSQLPSDHDEDITAAYLLEEWHLRPGLLLSLGLRYEHHSLVGGHLSPRGGLVFEPAPRHHVRLSFSRAFRNPSFLEAHWSARVEVAPGMVETLRGDPGNRPEEIDALEVGYQGLVHPGLLLNAAVFRHQLKRLIALETLSTFPSPPAPMPGIPAEEAFLNGASWDALGGEVSLQADVADWLRVTGHYSHVTLEDADTGANVGQAPGNSAALVARLRLGDLQHLQLTGRWRGKPTGTSGEVGDERVVVDAAWQIQQPGWSHRIAIGADNLLDQRFRDQPLGIEHRRRWFASVSVTF